MVRLIDAVESFRTPVILLSGLFLEIFLFSVVFYIPDVLIGWGRVFSFFSSSSSVWHHCHIASIMDAG